MNDEDYKIYKERQQSEFYQKYPQMFPKGEPYCGFYCDYGWWPLINRLCSDISTEVDKLGLEGNDKTKPSVTVAQIKEKFGGLRYYVDFENSDESFMKKINALIHEAEEKSFTICEMCGEPGKMAAKKSWMKTLCEKCKVY